MAQVNPHYLHFSKKYLFPLIEEQLEQLLSANPDADVIRLGVGDISLPLAPTIVKGIVKAAQEMGSHPHGYGPSNGYLSLRNRIIETSYRECGIDADEIFISDGINGDICSLQELFSLDQRVGVIDPAYPLYKDLQALSGREDVTLIPLLAENAFLPIPPKEPLDLVYLCSPHNPTGVAMTRENLTAWVNWALKHKAVLFFDGAYQSFITDPAIPQSIYEIPGAHRVAIECRSFSKSSGFTGLRLGYSVVPKELEISANGKWLHLLPHFRTRQDIKTNGVSFISQMAGLAALSPEGLVETKAQVSEYQKHARMIKQAIEEAGFICYGGENSPYLWWDIRRLGKSWDVFSELLHKHHILSMPGAGFGLNGEGYIRLSAFISEKTVHTFTERLQKVALCESI